MGLGFPAQPVMSMLREVRMPADERWEKEIFKYDLYFFQNTILIHRVQTF